MLWFLISLLFVGLIAGFLARALVPGRSRLTIRGTIALGIVGSFLGGFLGYVLLDRDPSGGAVQPSGLIGSVIGSIVALLVLRTIQRRRGRAR